MTDVSSSPRRTLAVSIIGPVILLAAALTALVLVHAALLARQHDRNGAEHTALLVAGLVADAIETYRYPQALHDYLVRLTEERVLQSVVVASLDPPRVIASDDPAETGRALESIGDGELAAHMLAVARGTASDALGGGLPGGRLYAQRITPRSAGTGTDPVQGAVIGIRFDPEVFHGLESELLQAFVVWTLAAAAVAILLFVWILRRRLLRPMEAIRSVVRQRRTGVRDVRIGPLRPDELGELAADINEAMDFIDAREERMRRLATIAQGTDNSIMVTTPDGVIEWTNDAFTRLTGYAAGEARGRRPRDFLHAPGEEPANAGQVWEAILAGRRVANEVQALSKDGRRLVVESEGYPIVNDGGDVTGCVFIAHDVTERRSTQQEIVSALTRFEQDLAFDLHDHVGGDLGGLSFRAKTLAERLARAGRPEAGTAEELHAALGAIAGRARSLSRALAPTAPEQGGLVVALERLCQSTSAYADVEVLLRRSGELPELAAWRANHVYLIAQEALRNAVRHGRASRIHVKLAGRPDALVLRVTSLQGRWDPQAHRDGLGIRIIRFRAQTLNAVLNIRVHRTGVTQVTVEVPAAPGEEARPEPVAGG